MAKDKIDEELLDFLSSRGLSEEQLIRIEDDKIDRHVILLMDDDALQQYIPSYGDRLSTVAFCKRLAPTTESKQGNSEPHSRKKCLVDRLRQKLKLRTKNRSFSTEPDNQDQTPVQAGTSGKSGNKNAKKDLRRVDMGWLNFDSSSKVFKLVRPKHGGGMRSLTVSRCTSKGDLLQLGKSLFFPNDRSTLGTADQFEFDLKDYQHSTFEEGCTVGQLYDTTKFKLLRFYLSSVKRDHPTSDNDFNNSTSDFQLSDEGDDSDLPDLGPAFSRCEERAGHSKFDDMKGDAVLGVESHSVPISTSAEGIVSSGVGEIQPSVSVNVPEHATDTVCQEIAVSSDCSNAEIVDLSTDSEIAFGPLEVSTPMQQDDTAVIVDGIVFQDELDYDVDESMSLMSYPDETKATITLKVHRGNTLEDMIPVFSDPSVLTSEILVQRVLPDGKEEAGMGIGVLKDTLTEFWGEFAERCTVGDRHKVPFVRHDYSKIRWEAIARVIVKGWQMVRYFPIFIAPAFMEEVLFSTQPASLTEMFLQHISEAERSVISQAMTDYNSVDEDDVVDVLNQYQCKKLPKAGNLVEIVEEIANAELIQKPSFIAECWKPILRMNLACDIDRSTLLSMYQQLQPNVFKVQKQMKFQEHMGDTENEVARYLKKYVMGLDQDMLKKFLRFCTGFDIMPDDVIHVNMVDLEGLARRPVAHTCGNVLELPRSYHNFPEFRTEFNAVLNSNVWVMDIA